MLYSSNEVPIEMTEIEDNINHGINGSVNDSIHITEEADPYYQANGLRKRLVNKQEED